MYTPLRRRFSRKEKRRKVLSRKTKKEQKSQENRYFDVCKK